MKKIITLSIFALSACSGGADKTTATDHAAEAQPDMAAAAKPAEANPAEAAAAKPAADHAAEAAALYTTRCVTCHGVAGKGDGPAGAALTPKARDFTDAKWQADTKDQMIKDSIVKGGPAVQKSPLMPPNPDLAGKPEVVEELVKMIRGFKG